MPSPSPLFRLRLAAGWSCRFDVSRPAGSVTFDPESGTYTDPSTQVGTSVGGHLSSNLADRHADVGGEQQVMSAFRLDYDPTVALQVDDRLTIVEHGNAALVGETFHVTSTAAVTHGTFGVAEVQRTEPDREG